MAEQRRSFPIKLNREEVDALTKKGKYRLPEGIRKTIHEIELLKAKNRVLELELEKEVAKHRH